MARRKPSKTRKPCPATKQERETLPDYLDVVRYDGPPLFHYIFSWVFEDQLLIDCGEWSQTDIVYFKNRPPRIESWEARIRANIEANIKRKFGRYYDAWSVKLLHIGAGESDRGQLINDWREKLTGLKN